MAIEHTSSAHTPGGASGANKTPDLVARTIAEGHDLVWAQINVWNEEKRLKSSTLNGIKYNLHHYKEGQLTLQQLTVKQPNGKYCDKAIVSSGGQPLSTFQLTYEYGPDESPTPMRHD